MSKLFSITHGGEYREGHNNLYEGTLADALLWASDNEEVMLPGSRLSIAAGGLRSLVRRKYGLEPAQFAVLSNCKADDYTRRLTRTVEREFRRSYPAEWAKLVQMNTDAATSTRLRTERTALHVSLREWAAGPLVMERPQGSSYHHLMDYDLTNHIGGQPTLDEIHAKYGEPQCIVVENDWAKAMEGKGLDIGDVRMPFPHTLWEFRISGVRVLCFTRTENIAEPMTYCVYGRDGVWVCDDYIYVFGENGLGRKIQYDERLTDPREFYKVNRLVHAQIRAACVLLDVQATERQPISAERKVVERRVKEGRIPPRDYEVVRLARAVRSAPRSAGAGVTLGTRAPQRGHLRRGTWIHYENDHSGEVKYVARVEDGVTVWHSKTWRRWHWAGDLGNMIEREYRL